MPITHYPATVDDFQELIKGDKLVVVDFFATWCGPCKVIAPKFEVFSDTYTDAIFAKVDVDKAAEISELVGVRAMPTFILFKNGEKVGEVIGASAAKLENAIKSGLN